jgi:outer membrane protein
LGYFGCGGIDIDTTADLNHEALKIDLDVDPWVYMIGVGYKF